MKFRKGLFLLFTFAFSFSFVQAQQAREVFGKNRIQYRQFDWVYLSGENFDVYYYDGRKTVATQALEFLESEFDRITDLIGYPPFGDISGRTVDKPFRQIHQDGTLKNILQASSEHHFVYHQIGDLK